MERIRPAAEATRVKAPLRDGGEASVELRVSAGCARPDEADVGELMRLADEPMYADKQT